MTDRAAEVEETDVVLEHDRWRQAYDTQIGAEEAVHNRSGIEIKPIYSPVDWDDQRYATDLGFPGQLPMTRGVYTTMHRGRTWSQRQLVGLGTPKDYNERIKRLLDAGASAISIAPCNSFLRGLDCDEVDPLLLGTCGTVINTTDDIDRCLSDVNIAEISTALNDPTPFTMLAFLLGVAKRRGIPWSKISGTSNQSDYISHYVANHMFLRLSLPGARRMLLDHIQFCLEHIPKWRPVSVVGQHMQQAGATPAEAMAFTLSTAIQYAQDCRDRGMASDSFLPSFSFFFDISISFFEEVAKFRAGRRLWARIAKERFGATEARSWRLKFHAQTSGVDLARQQPLNNIARVATQAIAGIFGGPQSMHTNSYDEALSSPTEEAAKVAIATQNILRDEAHLCDVIDPLAGSYYVETLTNEMEAEIESIIAKVDAAGGMYEAVKSGRIQTMIGESALAYQQRVDDGTQKIVGVNAYQSDDDSDRTLKVYRPDLVKMKAQVAELKAFKQGRSQSEVSSALDALARAANSEGQNLFAKVVDAATAGVTHGEVVGLLRREVGSGHPLVLV